MKFSDFIIKNGPFEICEIDIKKAVKYFRINRNTIISRWHDEFRIVSKSGRLKVNIFEKDAMELIEMLDLKRHFSNAFNNASTYYLDW
jgi:hypothetical protein